MEWTKDSTLELLNALMERPCLWDVSVKEYRDKTKKADCFRELELLFNCSRVNIEKKISSLRSQYSRELQKIKTSRKSGGTVDDVYTSKWFAFEAMSFMRGGNNPKKTRTLLPSQVENYSQSTQSMEGDDDDDDDYYDDDTSEVRLNDNEASASTSSSTIASTPKRITRKRKFDEFVSIAIETMKQMAPPKEKSLLQGENRDECDIFGELVGVEVRQIQDPVVRETLKSNILKLVYDTKIAQLVPNEQVI
ncbi:uncharacterized protein [Periplaneta americana]|uniref:uncharacterized protein n=1 Tax=Periplaneta americana TaxID=6978 RepID=UPI0037E87F83